MLGSGEKTAAEWENAFAASEFALPHVSPPARREMSKTSARPLDVGFLKTLRLLMARQWRVLKADRMNLVFFAAQPLLIGLLIGWVADKFALRMFLCLVATMWFGCSNGAQQIVTELPIFRRERVCGQGMNVYVLSKWLFLTIASLAQAMVLLTTTLTIAHFNYPETCDPPKSDFVRRFSPPPVTTDTPVNPEADDFDPPPAVTVDITKLEYRIVRGICHFFQITKNLIDSGPRELAYQNAGVWLDEPPAPVYLPGVSITNLLMVTIGLRFAAVALAAMVGVAIGLAISSLVNNATQAVIWVPLILIPQILFGGVVVTIPEMTRSVRLISGIMPSACSQRIVDVSALYGHSAPEVSNKTKVPAFIAEDDPGEEVAWIDADGNEVSENYDRISPINTAWQNLTVIPEKLGQRKTERKVEPKNDTVPGRRDVIFTQGTVYLSIAAAQTAMLVLLIWMAACYLLILIGLRSKQTGK